MRARLINEELSRREVISRIADDIFGIWDEFEENRNHISWYSTNYKGEPCIMIEFDAGYSNDFKNEVNEYLKNYKIKNFGGDYPIEWEWDLDIEDSLLIKTI